MTAKYFWLMQKTHIRVPGQRDKHKKCRTCYLENADLTSTHLFDHCKKFLFWRIILSTKFQINEQFCGNSISPILTKTSQNLQNFVRISYFLSSILGRCIPFWPVERAVHQMVDPGHRKVVVGRKAPLLHRDAETKRMATVC